MKKFKKKGFTLIELIAVLVIMAIIALIVTPLVMNVIRKARVSADKRSVDAYGRSIELAIAGYLLDNGKFPTEISQLTIEYSGNKVECETTQINTDSSVYLAGCTVAGRNVDYEYGKDKSPSYTEYTVGDQVKYNNVDYYVIKNSGIKDVNVTLLKAEPLTYQEVGNYGSPYSLNPQNVVGYGGLPFATGSEKTYSNSNAKKIVDAWADDALVIEDLVIDFTGYSARLLTFDELVNSLGFTVTDVTRCNTVFNHDEKVPGFVYNSNYDYWTMSNFVYCGDQTDIRIWSVGKNGQLDTNGNYYPYVIRPVITISKTADIIKLS